MKAFPTSTEEGDEEQVHSAILQGRSRSAAPCSSQEKKFTHGGIKPSAETCKIEPGYHRSCVIAVKPWLRKKMEAFPEILTIIFHTSGGTYVECKKGDYIMPDGFSQ